MQWMIEPYSVLELREELTAETIEFARFFESALDQSIRMCIDDSEITL